MKSPHTAKTEFSVCQFPFMCVLHQCFSYSFGYALVLFAQLLMWLYIVSMKSIKYWNPWEQPLGLQSFLLAIILISY